MRGDYCVQRWLDLHPIKGSVSLIAIGKAAASMAQGALAALPKQIENGLVITKKSHCLPLDSRFKCFESAHPLPDQTSLDAGNHLLHYIQAIPLHSQVLVLISGGASALVEVLPEKVSLQDWRFINSWLLSHPVTIEQVNYVRKRLSCIKAGRLAHYFADRRVICLMISDVPNNDPATIGSGLLVPHRMTTAPWLNQLPSQIKELLECAPPPPAINDPCFNSINTALVATLNDAKHAAQTAAQSMGLDTIYHDTFIEGDAIKVGETLARQLIKGPRGLHIWGGETTVKLPAQPGKGGRNQSMALAAAHVLQNTPNVFFLAAGTDGTDGPGDDAGAIVNGETIGRGEKTLLKNASWYLENADAGSFLAVSGDLLHTGPTGTNVMDLMLGLKT